MLVSINDLAACGSNGGLLIKTDGKLTLGLGQKTLRKEDLWRANPSTCVTTVGSSFTLQVEKKQREIKENCAARRALWSILSKYRQAIKAEASQ